jgi:hypothetical protein
MRSKTSHEVDGTGERSMAGKERWTEIVQMETEQAESGSRSLEGKVIWICIIFIESQSK